MIPKIIEQQAQWQKLGEYNRTKVNLGSL